MKIIILFQHYMAAMAKCQGADLLGCLAMRIATNVSVTFFKTTENSWYFSEF